MGRSHGACSRGLTFQLRANCHTRKMHPHNRIHFIRYDHPMTKLLLCAAMLLGCDIYPPPRGTVVENDNGLCYLRMEHISFWQAESDVFCQCPDTIRVGDGFKVTFTRP